MDIRDHLRVLRGGEREDAEWSDLVSASAASLAVESTPVAAAPVVVDVADRSGADVGPRRATPTDPRDAVDLPEPVSALRHFVRPPLWQDVPRAFQQDGGPAARTLDGAIDADVAPLESDADLEAVAAEAPSVPARRRLTWRPVRRRAPEVHEPAGRAHLVTPPEEPTASERPPASGPDLETALAPADVHAVPVLETVPPTAAIDVEAEPVIVAEALETEGDAGLRPLVEPEPEFTSELTSDPALGTASHLEPAIAPEPAAVSQPMPEPDAQPEPLVQADPEPVQEEARPEPMPALETAVEAGAEPLLTPSRPSRRLRRSSRSVAKPVRLPPPPDLVARLLAQQSDAG